jgi:threonine dehydrogenase-like Zn-dependent dehydrogenase
VSLHAARQAGPLMGARVLITGMGPIGAPPFDATTK